MNQQSRKETDQKAIAASDEHNPQQHQAAEECGERQHGLPTQHGPDQTERWDDCHQFARFMLQTSSPRPVKNTANQDTDNSPRSDVSGR